MADLDDFNIQLQSNQASESDRPTKDPTIKLQANNINSYSSGKLPNYTTTENNDELHIQSSNYNLSQAGHPFACIATIFFKLLSLLFYLFIGIFSPDVITFISVMVLNAFDFWTVKNITGRLLIGLRWWSDYDEKGESVWKFQSFDLEFKSNPVDKAFFWTGQIVSSIVWAAFLFIKILSLSPFWALLNLINFALSAINLYGYYQCRGDHNKKIKNLQKQALKNIAGRILS